MTDLQRYEKLVTDFDIGYRKFKENDQIFIEFKEGSKKVDGYSYFVTYFCFDSNGRFVEVKLYE